LGAVSRLKLTALVMGFCLIARHVLEAMKPPHCDWVGGFSEDLYFFLKAKKDHGF